MSLHPKDPKITAYALGELKGEDLIAVEAYLKNSPEGRMAVREIRGFTQQLKAELATEVGSGAGATAAALKKYLAWAAALVAIVVGGYGIFAPKDSSQPVAAVTSDPSAPQQNRVVKVVMDPPAPRPEARGELRDFKIDVSGRDASVPPEVNRVQLYNVFWANMPALRKCYDLEKDKAPNMEGEVFFSFEISESGKALNLKTTRNSLRNDALSDCVEREMVGWSFPTSQKKSRTVLYPITFSTE